MKKTLILLLTLCLALSGTSRAHNEILEVIIRDLKNLESGRNISFHPILNNSAIKKNWTCNMSREFFEKLNVALQNVNVEKLSRKMNTTLATVREDLQNFLSYFPRGQILTVKHNSKRCSRSPSYHEILQCLIRNCDVNKI